MSYFFWVATFLVSGFISLFFAYPAKASDCQPLGANQLKLTIIAPEGGDYRIWLKQITPASSNNGLVLQVDASCPVPIAKNESRDVFGWVGSNDQNWPLTYTLSAGPHTLIVAGSDTLNAIDNGFFTANTMCLPFGEGDNCLLDAATPVEQQEQTELLKTEPTQQIAPPNKWPLMLLAAIWTIALVGAIALFVEKYRVFVKHIIAKRPNTHWSRHAFLPITLVRFVKKHHIFATIFLCVLAALTAAFIVGASVLAASEQSFEAESGALSGGAKIIENTQSSGGAYVSFGSLAASVANPSQNNPAPGSPGNPGGGNPGGGNPGGGGTPAGECAPYPAFPDENCTGWRHTDVTLTDCTSQTDQGYIWDSNVSFDSCYFSKSLTIYGNNIKITRSQIHGAVTPHWSKNYDFGGLTLSDVEIEQTDVEDINSAAIAGHNYSCLRCNVHHTLSGMHFGNNTTIRDSYTHDFQWRDEAHGTGIGTGQGHGSNSFIIHNNIQCNRISGPPICSSALSIYPEEDINGNTLHNVLVEKNLFNATGAYCVYAGGLPATNIDFVDNWFGKKFYPDCAGYGPVTSYSGGIGGDWINNIWADGSGPVIP